MIDIESKIDDIQKAIDGKYSLLHVCSGLDENFDMIKQSLIQRGYDISLINGSLFIRTHVPGNRIYFGEK